MRVLLDTHAWLWALSSPGRLGPEALGLLEDEGNELLLSASSSLEIAIKHALGKLALPEPPERYVPDRMRRTGVVPLAVEHVHALRVAALPKHHADPFDRLLIAQAQCEDVPIVTSDVKFSPYEVETIPAS